MGFIFIIYLVIFSLMFVHIIKVLIMSRVPWIYKGALISLLVITYWKFSWILRDSLLIVDIDQEHFKATLQKILIPRWSGSEGIYDVGIFIVQELNRLGFNGFRDEFIDPVSFTNVVGIMNPTAEKFLLLSCHYDTKYFEYTENFVGASDGAVPCAILLNLAKNLQFFLNNEFLQQNQIGLVLAFFDGHESSEDHNDDTYPLYGSHKFVKFETVPLKKIKLVIALNLLGSPNIFMSKYNNTYYLHKRMVDIEMKLNRLGKLSKSKQLFYRLQDHDNDIADDHYPFIEKGIPAMHIVPLTLPEVWHLEKDNLENLHWPTVRNLNAIVTQFVYEYLISV